MMMSGMIAGSSIVVRRVVDSARFLRLPATTGPFLLIAAGLWGDGPAHTGRR